MSKTERPNEKTLARTYAKAFAAVYHDELEKEGAKEAHRLARAAGMKALGIRKPTNRRGEKKAPSLPRQ